MRRMRIVNAVPNDHSNETNSDSEPNIAVNPNNPHEMAITAFTPPDSGLTNGPVYFSTDGGENWSLRFDVPGNGSVDQAISFASTSNELYMATLRADNQNLNVDRSADPSTGTPFPVLETRSNIDQPWVHAISVTSGPDSGKDRIYVGYNDTGVSKGATVDVCLDGLTGSPSFAQVRLDTRSGLRDGFHIRPKPHRDGTVYAGYQNWRSQSGNNTTMDMVLARDDNWGSNNFTDLKDPSDNTAGRIVASVVINEAGSLGGQRADNGFDIQVDPNNSDIVYISWIDNSGPNTTLRVRRSLNRGVDWSGDLITVDNASIATMAINIRGTVGLLYLQLVSGKWETHFRSTTDGTTWDDTLLARTATAGFIGDYMRLVAVYNDFYGVFPAMNTPAVANFFPNGGGTLRFQRNTSGASLLGTDGTTVISPSLDPFFVSVLERDCTIITDRNTFGKDEIDALLFQANPAVIGAAFYVAIDGFPANELGITAATFVGTPNVKPAITFDRVLSGLTVQATACSAPDQTNLNIPQRFTWTFQVSFTNHDDFTGENVPITMTASITSTGGINVTGQAVLTLTTQPNPYETDGPTSWLSVDLQVFQVLQGGHLPSTPGIALNAGPNDFIHRLLANTAGGYNDPALVRAPNHPFDLDLVAHEDTSAVELAQFVLDGFFLKPVFNFAIARVRYRALSNPAANVRVFFRLFQASTTSTDFQPGTTYATGGVGTTKVPLLGVVNGEVVTIPCFAAARTDPTNPQGLNAQTDPDNVGPVGEMIPPDGSGAEVQVYFGCWLDINQPTPVLPAVASAAGPFTPAQSIQQAIRGQHQCLVAEINMDPPEPQITTGASPATSDKLAQRNLTIVGVASPHQVPATFDIKPTAATLPVDQSPDELMIDWGNVPAGTQASIYLPGTSAQTILDMADKLYTRHGLSHSDAHTITCQARGITYVPIPPGIGSNYAGLMTIDVPATVKHGQTFKVITRQITNVFGRRPSPPPPPPKIELAQAQTTLAATDGKRDLIEWRRVKGTFQISIPVRTKAVLLGPEERLLSVLRWIAEGIPHHNRWYPVFLRYLAVIGGRVKALGGDPATILPSPTGYGGRQPEHHEEGEARRASTGKIAGLIFDRFGDFEGFLLDTEDGERQFFSREKDVKMLAERVWSERLRITVWAERDEPHRPLSIIIRERPAPFK